MSAVFFLVAFLFLVDAQIPRYIGCYRDSCGRDFPNGRGLNPNGGTYCGSACRGSNFIYAATQYYGECYCGNSYGRFGKADEGNCNTPCNSNGGERCGGAWHNSVFWAGVRCGDNIVALASIGGSYENCDDSNTNNNDGCDSNCQKEAGWNCPVTNTNGWTAGGRCTSVCADRIVVAGEACDDGNTNNNDGCTSNCGAVEAGWTCPTANKVGGTCTDINECTVTGCRDTAKNSVTECQDSVTNGAIPKNTRICRCNTGYLAIQSPSSREPTVTLTGTTAFSGCLDINECSAVSNACVDGISAQAVTCDDSNTVGTLLPNTRRCTCPTGFYADQVPSPTHNVVLTGTAVFTGCRPICGDRTVKTGEQCDDGNTAPRDGCSPTCQIEVGWTCSGATCNPICGNGMINGSEACDDGNARAGDGCSADCRSVENRYQCITPGQACVRVPVVCGDGHIEAPENCEDGNVISRDGCSASCLKEDGFTCPSTPGPCTNICGDGKRVQGENCDDGNSNGEDGCKNCQIVVGWTCPTAGVLCNPIYGDGLKVGSEECDDGNTIPGDGCTAVGKIEIGFTCPPTGACSDVDECAKYTCKPLTTNAKLTVASECAESKGAGVKVIPPNQRRCTCGTGWNVLGQAITVQVITLTADAAFSGCNDIDECAAYKCVDTNTKYPQVTSCQESGSSASVLNGLTAPPLNHRRCICPAGWYPGNTVPGTSNSVTLDGAVAFKGCQSYCGDKKTVGDEKCDDGNRVGGDGCSADCSKVEVGWTFNAATAQATAICGDGRKLGNETCDDNNTIADDGCSSVCHVEMGWTCSSQLPGVATDVHNIGNLCCPLISDKEFELHHLAEEVLCFDGYWTSNMSHTDPNVVVDIAESLRLAQNTKFCGTFSLNHELIIAENATVVIAGQFNIGPKGKLIFDGLGSRLIVNPICADFHVGATNWSGNPGSLVMHAESSIQVIDVQWDNGDEHPTAESALVTAHGCVELDGEFYLHANEIPSGSNTFSLIGSTTKCIKTASSEEEFLALSHQIPGSCSNLDISHDDDFAYITINKKDLCGGEIAGIAIGCFFGVLLLAAILFFLLNKGGADTDYQSL